MGGDYIDKLIRSEETEKRRGYQQRIRDLKQLKQNQNLISDVKDRNYKPFEQYKDVHDFINNNDLDEQKLKKEAEAIKREKQKMAEEKRRKEKKLQKEKARKIAEDKRRREEQLRKERERKAQQDRMRRREEQVRKERERKAQ